MVLVSNLFALSPNSQVPPTLQKPELPKMPPASSQQLAVPPLNWQVLEIDCHTSDP